VCSRLSHAERDVLLQLLLSHISSALEVQRLFIVTARFTKPMECVSVKKLPSGEQWTYEIKLDGFRVEAVRTQDRVTLYSKQEKLLTSQFMQVAFELDQLPPETALDGELVALDKNGCPNSTCCKTTAAGQHT
jgi:ATP-dependent DNA ligase